MMNRLIFKQLFQRRFRWIHFENSNENMLIHFIGIFIKESSIMSWFLKPYFIANLGLACTAASLFNLALFISLFNWAITTRFTITLGVVGEDNFWMSVYLLQILGHERGHLQLFSFQRHKTEVNGGLYPTSLRIFNFIITQPESLCQYLLSH